MLVVADQPAIGISGERRLAGAGKSEEQCRVALLADVRRAMHRKHALLWKEIVHHRENGLLELTGVARPADQNRALGNVEHDESPGSRAVPSGVRLEFRRMQDG